MTTDQLPERDARAKGELGVQPAQSVFRMILEVVGASRFEVGAPEISARLQLDLEETKEILRDLVRLGFLESDSIMKDGNFALTDRAVVLRMFNWNWSNPFERALGKVEKLIEDDYRDKPVKRATTIRTWEHITGKDYQARAAISRIRSRAGSE